MLDEPHVQALGAAIRSALYRAQARRIPPAAPPRNDSMRTGAVHVYVLNVATQRARLGEFSAILNSDERERAARFRFERDRERFVIRRGTLRELLALYLDEAPERIRFCVNRFGKLSLPGRRLRFNLSHSHGVALFALAEGREVGCDIERSDPRFAADHIPERLFSAREASTLRALPNRFADRRLLSLLDSQGGVRQSARARSVDSARQLRRVARAWRARHSAAGL